MKRKKRLQKGIDSLDKQKRIHEEKRKMALDLGQEELVAYYDKEINKFLNIKRKKKDLIDK